MKLESNYYEDQANRCLYEAASMDDDFPGCPNRIAEAQVYATLALAAEPMNHPSIGGKEQDPQTGDVPEDFIKAVSSALLPGQRFEWWWNLGSLSLRAVLDSIPPGWMKTEQGWVQMELCWLIDTVEVPPGVYRVKQPSED